MPGQIEDKYGLLSTLAKRRGFFWSSFEIYGGVGGFLDLGPPGLELKNLIVETWRETLLRPHGFVEISTPIITPHRLLVASGHVENFKDPMIECTNCRRRFRADQLVKEKTGIETEGKSLEELDSLIKQKGVKCPECGGILGFPQYFVTMFKTSIGPYGEDVAYGRPEAAQGIFVDFRRVFEVMREHFPLGIGQVGTVLRNEISPRQGPIRLREFTIMDFELFYNPQQPDCPFLSDVANDSLPLVTEETRRAGKEEVTKIPAGEAVKRGLVKAPWAGYFMCIALRLLKKLGINVASVRFFEKLAGERAHYSLQTFDLEVLLDRLGWVEVAGIAYRGDYDLRKHMEATGVDMSVFQAYEKPVEKTVKMVRVRHDRLRDKFGQESGKVAKVLAGQDLLALVSGKGPVKAGGYEIPMDCFEVREARTIETGSRFVPHVIEPSFGVERLVYATMEYALRMKEDRVVLSLPFDLAPFQASVYPLMNRDGLEEKAGLIYKLLLSNGIRTDYDEAGSIGRRYARADEAGVPFGVTVDYDTLKDDTVTLRDRDSWKQIRVPISQLTATIKQAGEKGFEKF